ncbi:MAG TPA: DUF1343 domain-containing protein [Flavobacteriales bacterium]|nr:DUF1343 domain-containing protein [Flavobacteriales bacterium]
MRRDAINRPIFIYQLTQLKYTKYFIALVFCVFLYANTSAQLNIAYNKNILTGADNLLANPASLALEGKNIAICANQTSILKNKTHLVDTLLSKKYKIVKIFTPEHGLRGTADAGEKVASAVDKKTGIPIVSLYGNNKKPTADQLKGIDVVIFDLQDVGARFYTYISTLHYVMEACAQNNIPIVVLDRPNPNGFYVDGPVLDTSLRSFVGMHPVPIVHGMTIGEYAFMIKGEKWIKKAETCSLTVVRCESYTHKDFYELPVAPSPNLTSMQAIYYYPTTCLFEGTTLSVGRGTKYPFRNIGMPGFKAGKNYFTPKPTPGAKEPKYNGQKCRGIFITDSMVNAFLKKPAIDTHLLVTMYKNSASQSKFFPEKGSFDILTGDKMFKWSIIATAVSGEDMTYAWQKGLKKFKAIRKKYLLYTDYE